MERMMPAPVQTDGDLPAARRRLTYAIDALIEPLPVVVDRDDGTKPITWLDSLLDQLYDAVSGQTGERSGGQSSIPIWADVSILLADIERDCAQWSPEWPQIDGDLSPHHPPTPVAVLRLKTLRAKKWSVEDTALVNRIAADFEAHTKQAKELLSGRPSIPIYEPDSHNLVACPTCGHRYVYKRDSSGQHVRQPALQILASGTTQCMNRECSSEWGPERMAFLGRLLGFDNKSGVLE